MSATTDLTTLSDLKAWITTNPSDTTFDATFGQLITAASLFIARYCNRNFMVQTYTENRDGNSRDRLLLRNFPVASVNSVTINGVTVPAAPDTVSSGFIAPDPSSNHGLLMLRGFQFCKGYQNVIVNYSAGMFANTAAATVSDVGWACRELCNQKWKKRPRPDAVSWSQGGAITEAFSQKDMPPEVQTLLNQVMNPVVPIG